MADVEPATDAELAAVREMVDRTRMELVMRDHSYVPVARLLARLDQAEARGAWREIDDEARSGKPVQITDGQNVYAAYWSQAPHAYGGSKRHPWVILDETNGVNGLEAAYATHWQPLPAPPRAGGEP